MRHVVLSPHIGGNSAGCFRRAHRMVWESFQDVLDGRRPQFVVNGV
jgi:phosphoglycerate dehydrogenase-like enzyme